MPRMGHGLLGLMSARSLTDALPAMHSARNLHGATHSSKGLQACKEPLSGKEPAGLAHMHQVAKDLRGSPQWLGAPRPQGAL